MTIEQTVDIPVSRRITFEVPPQIPVGKAILTLTAVLAKEDSEYTQRIWFNNRAYPENLKETLQNLQGSLGNNAFDGLDGVAYQRKIREEWDD